MVEADSRVVTSEQKQGAVAWPLPVEEKLDLILREAEEAGERTSRKEIVAALIATYGGNGEAMSSLLRRYRKMTVRDLLGIPEDENVIDIAQRRKPGPRPRNRGGVAVRTTHRRR